MTCCGSKGAQRKKTGKKNNKSGKKSTGATDGCDILEGFAPIKNLGGKEMKQIQVMLNCINAKGIDQLPNNPIDRCRHLASVIETADKYREPDALPIFVAPEWYFRKRADNRGLRYTKDEYEQTVMELVKISQSFPEMLIVAGSISWIEPPEIPREDEIPMIRLTTKQLDRVHNTSPILLNGEFFLYHKKKDIDVSPTAKERFDIPEGMHGVFKASGLTMGMSICGDSLMLLEDYQKLDPGGEGVDVHILIAQGQDLSKISCASKDKGLVIRVDAEGGGACESHVVKRGKPISNVQEVEWLETLEAKEIGSLLVYPPVARPTQLLTAERGIII
jgi:hypothetical protein